MIVRHQDTSEIVNNILKEKYGPNYNTKSYIEYESKATKNESGSLEAYTNDNSVGGL